MNQNIVEVNENINKVTFRNTGELKILPKYKQFEISKEKNYGFYEKIPIMFAYDDQGFKYSVMLQIVPSTYTEKIFELRWITYSADENKTTMEYDIIEGNVNTFDLYEDIMGLDSEKTRIQLQTFVDVINRNLSINIKVS